MKRPPHPGEVILRDYLLPTGISCRQMSRALKVVNGRFANVLRGLADLDAELALRLSRVLGRSARSWLTMQGDYDLWKVKAEVDLREVRPIGKVRGYWKRLVRPLPERPPRRRRK